ncbi:hypothetical protein Q9L58_000937 [Maublancomyces gigas]|uniref:Zinc finger CHCC-type domain-containing protein n=1 Tax=Discina gigas TaxID=1032678 RepID=A0ABR3GW19_9PEZI
MLPRLRSPLTRCAAAARPLTRLYSQTVHPSITTPNTPTAPNASATNATPVRDSLADDLQEPVLEAERKRHMQAPNRPTTWSRSQRPRELGMVGPRFEQTIIERQPAPYAAIELIHQQPVRWSEKRVVVCDGGGGAHGHPRIFINVDKPEIVPCGYCGLPFAHVHHKGVLQKLEAPGYPLA